MKTEDWDVASYSGSSDSDVTSPDSDNEDRCYAFGDLPKLQFRFLAEIGALHLLDDEDKCIPLENIYKKVAAGLGGSSWETFEIYRHVKSLGYIIKRHGVCWSHKRCKTVPAFLVGESGSQTITENGTEDIDSINEISELFSTMKINDMRPVFDVYPPSSKFRKSSPGNPMFILCVNRAEVKRFLMLELRSNRLQDFCNASISISLPNSPSSSQASPTPQDKWSREKHTKLVNIVGEPSAGMLTRQMSKGLSVASASE
ncbi:tRNA-splicing endonuclease, subunit Sen54 [Artemisia annua]|uniref:tRNA-splicing endonuclease, subunit Sen54 n=1 Tax=Artemisia annua TaxID=35608 RepID=A0A2U1K996_ARTAN|nr:tRNA-splicing endonuclease, subunit Sen54 [Artemisia annua]